MNTDALHSLYDALGSSPPLFHAPFRSPAFEREQRDAGRAMRRVLSHQGREYLLAFAAADLIFFRDMARNLPEWTWFLRGPNITEGALDWTTSEWEHALRTAQGGRCVACKPGGRYGQSVFTLLFATDGTGQYHDTYSTHSILDFTWDWKQTILTSPDHLLTADLVDLSLFSPRSFYAHCEDIITRQIAKRIANPYIETGDLQDKPITFTCGSEEELKRVTTWICHTEKDLFAQHTEYHLIYWSPVEGHGRRTFLIPSIQGRFFLSVYSSGGTKLPERLRTLCHLAYRHNTFSGWRWVYRFNNYRFNKFKPPSRRKGYRPHRGSVDVTIAAPSAHERAEALLALHEWLDGKVSAKRRQRLLGLD